MEVTLEEDGEGHMDLAEMAQFILVKMLASEVVSEVVMALAAVMALAVMEVLVEVTALVTITQDSMDLVGSMVLDMVLETNMVLAMVLMVMTDSEMVTVLMEDMAWVLDMILMNTVFMVIIPMLQILLVLAMVSNFVCF